MNEETKNAVKAISVLVIIAVVCVFLLAILNDLLFVPPDITKFAKTVEGEYTVIDTADAEVTKGSVDVVAEGTSADGKEVVGLYITCDRAGSKPSACVIVVIIDKQTDVIIGVSVVKDGSSASQYVHKQEFIDKIVGKQITSADVFDSESYTIQAGATETSQTIRNGYIVAAQYYWQVYMGGND